MPKYLFEVSYTREGVAGIVKEGGTTRREAVSQTVAGLGGQLESFYFAFGDRDVFVTADLPDHEAATAVAMAGNASGGLVVKTTVLLTPEQVDEAAHRSVEFRAPGR
jgi:uncharacterized protein with GYD domain